MFVIKRSNKEFLVSNSLVWSKKLEHAKKFKIAEQVHEHIENNKLVDCWLVEIFEGKEIAAYKAS